MCMSPKMQMPAAPTIPESVKRVADDQRRVVQGNQAAGMAAAFQTNKTQGSLIGVNAPTQKKSLLGI